jgi:GntR family carbon starvation induced transcriptional regulator
MRLGTTNSPISLTDALTARLREEILSARLVPNGRLRFQELRETYRASVGALREALSRLAADSLVELHNQRGFRVAPVSVGDLIDIFESLKVLEGGALRRAILEGDDEWEVRVITARHRMTKIENRQAKNPSYELAREWERRHTEFHQALISGCRSHRLMQYCKLLREQALRYRHLVQVPPAQHPLLDVQHVAIVKAALDRDADFAYRILVEHFDRAASIIREALERQILKAM